MFDWNHVQNDFIYQTGGSTTTESYIPCKLYLGTQLAMLGGKEVSGGIQMFRCLDGFR
jgi:hypothetical protein